MKKDEAPALYRNTSSRRVEQDDLAAAANTTAQIAPTHHSPRARLKSATEDTGALRVGLAGG